MLDRALDSTSSTAAGVGPMRRPRDKRTENELVEMMDRLLRLACEECPKCAEFLEPIKVAGYWRHRHDLCRAPSTHDRVSELDAQLEALYASAGAS
jgi:hypothetical protein